VTRPRMQTIIEQRLRSGVARGRNSSMWSKMLITSLQSVSYCEMLGLFFRHALSSALVFFSLAEMVAAGLVPWLWVVQTLDIRSLKPAAWIQWFSNLKTVDFGTDVETSILSGTWSEVVRVIEDKTVLGRLSSQVRLIKARSSLSRVGVARRLDQNVCPAAGARSSKGHWYNR
jgi:hypothetical protein